MFSFVGCATGDILSEVSQGLTEYSINVDFDIATKSAHCDQLVTYVNNSDDILREVKFHLYPQYFEEGKTAYVVSSTKLNNAYPNGMSFADFEVSRVTINGADVGVVYEGEADGILVVELGHSLFPNDFVEIGIEYSFTLPNCHHRFGYGDDTINLGNFYPIACVYVDGVFSVDPYNSNGDPFYSDIANYIVNLSVDSDMKVASTGNQQIVTTNSGLTQYKIEERAVRDFAVVMSEYFEVVTSSFKDIAIKYYFYSDDNAEQSLQAGVDALATFSRFGEYPYRQFSIVQTDFVHGGMEYPELVYVSDAIANHDDYMNVIIHETAHQWWYGLVGNDEYRTPWLDEALTEYCTILFYDWNDEYSYNHSDMITASKENYTLFVTVYRDVLGDLDTSMRAVDEYNTEPEYVYCIYVKGVLMHESLYSLVGEKDFVRSLQRYYANYRFSNATMCDFVKCFEEECGMSLSSFFDSWLSGKVVVR